MDDMPDLLPASIDQRGDRSIAAPPDESDETSPGRTLGYAALGLFYRSMKRARRRATSVSNRLDRLSRIAVAPLQPITDSSLFQPIRKQVDSLAARGQQELDSLMRDGQIGEQRSRQITQKVLNTVVGGVIEDISSNPQIQILIQQQVEIMAEETPGSPQLDELVRKLADNYINYLNEHPEQVQNLVAGQSISLTAQIREEVNMRLVTGDSLLEMLARRMFRRPPRADLPGPPPEVKEANKQSIFESNLSELQPRQNERN